MGPPTCSPHRHPSVAGGEPQHGDLLMGEACNESSFYGAANLCPTSPWGPFSSLSSSSTYPCSKTIGDFSTSFGVHQSQVEVLGFPYKPALVHHSRMPPPHGQKPGPKTPPAPALGPHMHHEGPKVGLRQVGPHLLLETQHLFPLQGPWGHRRGQRAQAPGGPMEDPNGLGGPPRSR